MFDASVTVPYVPLSDTIPEYFGEYDSILTVERAREPRSTALTSLHLVMRNESHEVRPLFYRVRLGRVVLQYITRCDSSNRPADVLVTRVRATCPPSDSDRLSPDPCYPYLNVLVPRLAVLFV